MKVYFVEIFNTDNIETHVNQTYEGAIKRVADYCRREWPKHFRKPLKAQGDETRSTSISRASAASITRSARRSWGHEHQGRRTRARHDPRRR